MQRHGARRRECGVTSVLADGQNLDVGAIHLPRADKKTRGPRAASRVGYLEKPAEMDGETLIVN